MIVVISMTFSGLSCSVLSWGLTDHTGLTCLEPALGNSRKFKFTPYYYASMFATGFKLTDEGMNDYYYGYTDTSDATEGL